MNHPSDPNSVSLQAADKMFGIVQYRRGDVMIVELKGRLRIEDRTSASLHRAVEMILKDGGKKILLDLKELTTVDSSGLGELVQCQALARREHATLKLLHLNSRIRELLELTKLDELFDEVSDESTALSSFSE